MLPMPDFAELHLQQQQHRHLTQQLLWEEYRLVHNAHRIEMKGDSMRKNRGR